MDTEKVQAVENWEAAEELKEVQSFLGFADLYQWFRRNFSRVVQSLTKLMQKLGPFH
jgi:hypothetical protein